MIEAPHVRGPPDDPPTCCGRNYMEALLEHVDDCELGRELDRHEDCDVPMCSCDEFCDCPCEHCARVRRARAEYESLGRDPDEHERWDDDE